jgi:hypothetical protein
MPDVWVPIGLGGESDDDIPCDPTCLEVVIDDLLDEVSAFPGA